jgi:hypothetical protein
MAQRSPAILIDEDGIHYLISEENYYATPRDRDIRWENVAEVRQEKRLGGRNRLHWFKVIVLTMKDGAVQEVDMAGLTYYGTEALGDALKRLHSASSN